MVLVMVFIAALFFFAADQLLSVIISFILNLGS
jgi:preprotein translocase subunit SecE